MSRGKRENNLFVVIDGGKAQKNTYTFEKIFDKEEFSSEYYGSNSMYIYALNDNFAKSYNRADDAKVYGQLKTVLGEPLYERKDFYSQYQYWIKATDEEGNSNYMEIYSQGAGPAISGYNEKAVNQLVKSIQNATPTDYDYEVYNLEGLFEEYESSNVKAPYKIEMGVNSGKVYYREIPLTLSTEELDKLKTKVDEAIKINID